MINIIILCLSITINVPIDYFYEEPKRVGINKMVNIKERRKR